MPLCILHSGEWREREKERVGSNNVVCFNYLIVTFVPSPFCNNNVILCFSFSTFILLPPAEEVVEAEEMGMKWEERKAGDAEGENKWSRIIFSFSGILFSSALSHSVELRYHFPRFASVLLFSSFAL